MTAGDLLFLVVIAVAGIELVRQWWSGPERW